MLKISNIFESAKQYDNVAAHNELRSMMERGERLKMFFCVDSFGYESLKIESNTTTRFNYQLTQEGMDWIISYLTQGIVDDNNLDPTPKEKTEETSDNFRKKMLMAFVEAKVGNFQTLPAFLSRPGRLTSTASFKHGSIMFFLERDEEIEEFLRDRKMIA